MDVSELKQIPLFAEVPDEQLHKIAPFTSLTSAGEGKTVIREGGYSNDFYAIQEGTVKVERDGEKLAELGPGDFFGEMGLLGDDRRNATVVATSPMRLLTLDQWDMKRLEKAVPSAADKIRSAARSRGNA